MSKKDELNEEKLSMQRRILEFIATGTRAAVRGERSRAIRCLGAALQEKHQVPEVTFERARVLIERAEDSPYATGAPTSISPEVFRAGSAILDLALAGCSITVKSWGKSGRFIVSAQDLDGKVAEEIGEDVIDCLEKVGRETQSRQQAPVLATQPQSTEYPI